MIDMVYDHEFLQEERAKLALLNWVTTIPGVTEGVCVERLGSFFDQYPEHASLLP